MEGARGCGAGHIAPLRFPPVPVVPWGCMRCAKGVDGVLCCAGRGVPRAPQVVLCGMDGQAGAQSLPAAAAGCGVQAPRPPPRRGVQVKALARAGAATCHLPPAHALPPALPPHARHCTLNRTRTPPPPPPHLHARRLLDHDWPLAGRVVTVGRQRQRVGVPWAALLSAQQGHQLHKLLAIQRYSGTAAKDAPDRQRHEQEGSRTAAADGAARPHLDPQPSRSTTHARRCRCRCRCRPPARP